MRKDDVVFAGVLIIALAMVIGGCVTIIIDRHDARKNISCRCYQPCRCCNNRDDCECCCSVDGKCKLKAKASD
jgi:hypothetical protein